MDPNPRSWRGWLAFPLHQLKGLGLGAGGTSTNGTQLVCKAHPILNRWKSEGAKTENHGSSSGKVSEDVKMSGLFTLKMGGNISYQQIVLDLNTRMSQLIVGWVESSYKPPVSDVCWS